MAWVVEALEGPSKRLGTARTVPTLTELGRVQLSKSLFMRDMWSAPNVLTTDTLDGFEV